jgi:hypothetical protein
MTELAVRFIINIGITVSCFLVLAGAAFIIEWSIESVDRLHTITFPARHFPEAYIRTISLLAQFIFFVDVNGFIAIIGVHCAEFCRRGFKSIPRYETITHEYPWPFKRHIIPT